MEQLKDRVLRVRARPAPGDRRGRLADWRSVELHRLAVRFHLELLEIERQQPQPLIVGEDGARLAFELADIETVDEGRNQRRIVGGLGISEMPVHLGRAFEQFLERTPAQARARRRSRSRPQRIAAADPLAELEDARLVDAASTAASGPAVTAITRPIGIVHAALSKPGNGGIQVGHGLGGGEGLRGDDDQGRFRIEGRDGIVERRAIDIGKEANVGS